MSQADITVEQPKGTVGVNRKISDGNYGSYEFQLFLPVPFDESVPVSEQGDLVRQFFALAKELIGEQTSPLLEGLVANAVAKQTGGTVSRSPRPAQTDSDTPDVVLFCETCNSDQAFYDNRPKIASGAYKPKAPKVKCKNCKSGLWDLPDGV